MNILEEKLIQVKREEPVMEEKLKGFVNELEEVIGEVRKLPDFIKELENQRIIGDKEQDLLMVRTSDYFELIAHLLMFFIPELDPSGESQNRTKEEQVTEMRIISSKLHQYFIKNVLFRLQTTLDASEFLQYMKVCENFCHQSEKIRGGKMVK